MSRIKRMKQPLHRIKDLPKTERPREKLISKGFENLKDEDLLAILLGTGTSGKNVIEVANICIGSDTYDTPIKLVK
jgi:DNA repair protein RadC